MDLQLSCYPFGSETFYDLVRRAAGLEPDAPPADQVRYLYTYLKHEEMGAQTLLVEHPYVDRHFLMEFQGYYATALRPPAPTTSRIHVFRERWTDEQLDGLLAGCMGDEALEQLRARLQQAYLGFIVVRPLPSAPIGRTVLATYPLQNTRIFGPLPPPHRVHVLGLTLKAHGVQFHQQDRAVGACATAAVWCALAAVMRRDGARSPTPLAVTEQASRSVPSHRAFPAVSGLTREQMLGAMTAAGYAPDVIKPEANPALFLLVLTIYVRSGFPVVLQLHDPAQGEGHAVTLVGFRVSDEEEGADEIEVSTAMGYQLRSTGITRLYLHDDRLGPYARFRWHGGDEAGSAPRITFMPYAEGFDAYTAPMDVWCALAPLYPKIRLSVADLIDLAGGLLPVVWRLAGPEHRDQVRVEPYFARAGDYARAIHRLPITRARAVSLVRRLVLSRFVGIIRYMVGDRWLLDVICDATDILRSVPRNAAIIALVPADEGQFINLRNYVQGDPGPPMVG